MADRVRRLVITFRIEGRSGVPPYLQVVAQVRQALRMGALRVGDQLPTVKDVVRATAINPNTVLKAYRHLEHEGLVEGRPGLGTFVVAVPPGPPAEVHEALARRLVRWVTSARDAGLDDEAIAAMLEGVLRAHEAEGVA